MSVMQLHDGNYETEVVRAQGKVLLDFWAPWCGPCRMIAPTLEEIAGERPDIRVGKVNVDENPELAKKFRIISIPTLIVLEKGQVLDKAIGARPKEEILELLEI